MAYQETPTRANVEFLRSQLKGQGRVIRLNHTPDQVPPQLAARVDPGLWHQFMLEVEGLANRHPYVVKPDAKQAGKWAACGAIGAVIGVCFINPDGGDYPQWNSDAQHLVAQWRQRFAERGCSLTFVFNRNPYIQVDVDPAAPAYGAPAIPKAV